MHLYIFFLFHLYIYFKCIILYYIQNSVMKLNWHFSTAWYDSAQHGSERHGTAQFSTVCISTSSVQNYSRVIIMPPPRLPWLLKHFFIPPCSRYRLTIFSGQSVISRVYTSRFGNGTVRLEPGTRYCTQWKTPQERAVLNRTVPYHAVEKFHKLAQSDRSNSIWLNDMAQLIGFLLYQ